MTSEMSDNGKYVFTDEAFTTFLDKVINNSVDKALLRHTIKCPMIKNVIDPKEHQDAHSWLTLKMKKSDTVFLVIMNLASAIIGGSVVAAFAYKLSTYALKTSM